MRLPEYTTTRGNRRKCIQLVKDNIESFAKNLGFRLEGAEKAGRNESNGNKEVINLFKKKIEEDGGNTDLEKYLVNMGRTDVEVKDMRLRIKAELFEVLTKTEQQNFNLDIKDKYNFN